MNKFAQIITPEDVVNGHGTVVLEHNLGTEDVVVQLYYRELKSNHFILENHEIEIIDENRVVVIFLGASKPENVNIHNIRAVVIG